MDRNGTRYVSTMEAKKYPFTGEQGCSYVSLLANSVRATQPCHSDLNLLGYFFIAQVLHHEWHVRQTAGITR